MGTLGAKMRETAAINGNYPSTGCTVHHLRWRCNTHKWRLARVAATWSKQRSAVSESSLTPASPFPENASAIDAC